MKHLTNTNILRNSGLSLFLSLVLLACQTASIPEVGQQEPVINSNDRNSINTESPSPLPGKPAVSATISLPSYENLWLRMAAGFQLQEFYAYEPVSKQLNSYADNQRYFDLVTERASPFLFWIVEEIDRRNLPMELALVPFVESTFNPTAYSREHAVGLWQFLGPTGRSFGLQQDWWYDGRKDPRASTIAALDYLESLYAQFNEDWLLALAAYNTGEGNIRRAIRRADLNTETADFWSLGLARETRSHVPRILALARIIANSEEYGISLQPIANTKALALVEVGGQIDIAQAATLAQMDYEQLRKLNPGYLQWATHPDYPQSLVLPLEQLDAFTQALGYMNPEQLVTWDRYEILPGDTLGGIARKLGTRVDVLQTVNQISGSRIVAGDSLLIPRQGDGVDLANLPSARPPAPTSATVPATHRVRRGENLWSIARRYDIRSQDIARYNNIQLDSILQPGQVLDLSYVTANANAVGSSSNETIGAATHYSVRPGDSMDRIARRFGKALDELLLWNSFSGDEIIYPGQAIRVLPPDAELN